ncbi:hypothetical protein ACIPRL_07010 [Streptomyces sp. NPDC090085]|uniref:hypothetical protein n=1 Tax=Streptomyces sp. NPDC090085 TaxID=3365943 RepID=UPI003812485A
MNQNPGRPTAANAPGAPAPGLSTADLFTHCLTDDGLAWLDALLDDGRFDVRAPEHAALLCVAWLRRAGETAAAAGLVEELRPFAHEVRFAPCPAPEPAPAAGAVHRRTVGEVAVALAERLPRPAVAAQQEALTVWRPFEDELLGHWLRAEASPDGADPVEGAALLARYGRLAAAHTRCTGHLDPSSHPAVLRRALETRLATGGLPPRLAGELRRAVASMVAARGRPGSPGHRALRDAQAAQAGGPAHQDLTAPVLRRLAPLDVSLGTSRAQALAGPVTPAEAGESGLPAGTPLPAAVRDTVLLARSAPLVTLARSGAIPSAEAFAEVAAQLVASHPALGHRDEALGRVVAAVYAAGRSRRHALWWSAQHGERIAALPWMRAVAPWGDDSPAQARSVLRLVVETCVEAFPGAGIPNSLVQVVSPLAEAGGLGVPLLREPFAARYDGTVSPELLGAAADAAGLLRGTVYERHHRIDYAAVLELVAAGDREGFAALCAERAARPGGSLATEPAVAEQARILTTFNLATLVRRAGIAPPGGWQGAAVGAFADATRRSATAARSARAWRHAVLYLSLCGPQEREAAFTGFEARAARLPRRAADRFAPGLAGLRLALGAG